MNIWEAQYGDFSNMAQMMFDNFMSSARAKWGERSGLTLFLPHAFEGQDLNTLDTFRKILTTSGENNSTVVNLSSSSNYFHLLRAQAKSLGTEAMRPCNVSKKLIKK